MLGISCDHTASHRAWATALGGLPYPELSDWEPKGQVSRAYDLWNPERGASIRAVLIIDKDGVILTIGYLLLEDDPTPADVKRAYNLYVAASDAGYSKAKTHLAYRLAAGTFGCFMRAIGDSWMSPSSMSHFQNGRMDRNATDSVAGRTPSMLPARTR